MMFYQMTGQNFEWELEDDKRVLEHANQSWLSLRLSLTKHRHKITEENFQLRESHKVKGCKGEAADMLYSEQPLVFTLTQRDKSSPDKSLCCVTTSITSFLQSLYSIFTLKKMVNSSCVGLWRQEVAQASGFVFGIHWRSCYREQERGSPLPQWKNQNGLRGEIIKPWCASLTLCRPRRHRESTTPVQAKLSTTFIKQAAGTTPELAGANELMKPGLQMLLLPSLSRLEHIPAYTGEKTGKHSGQDNKKKRVQLVYMEIQTSRFQPSLSDHEAQYEGDCIISTSAQPLASPSTSELKSID
ncbi:hypothetical protein INR49_015759 [Caranx melampygus]|nr:hypothetical protein INR49_015759 [Caranx melampygus]